MYVHYMFYNNVFVCCSLVLPFNSSQQGGARLVVKCDDDAGGRQVRVKEHGGTSVETANETLTFYRRRCADYVGTILKELSQKKINSLIIQLQKTHFKYDTVRILNMLKYAMRHANEIYQCRHILTIKSIISLKNTFKNPLESVGLL